MKVRQAERQVVAVPRIPGYGYIILGFYALLSDEDYTNAEAFILTFSLNNYPREHPKFQVVQEWESRFLDIVQEYQKNPSTNFTFAYMAEVSLEMLCLFIVGGTEAKSRLEMERSPTFFSHISNYV